MNLIDNIIKTSTLSKVPFLILKVTCERIMTLFASDEISDYFGYSNEDFIEMTKYDCVPFVSVYDSERIRKGLESIINTDSVYDLSMQVKHSKGHFVSFDCQCVYLESQDDSSIFFCKNDTLKDTEIVLEKNPINQNDLYNALAFAGINVWTFDLINREIDFVISCIPADDKLFKNYPYELVNLGVISPNDASDFVKQIESLYSGISSLDYEYWFHFPGQKQPTYIKARYIVEFDENNRPVMAHGMSMDYTEEKNAETNFKHRTNAVLKTTPNALATIQLNLTENICNITSGMNFYLFNSDKVHTVDDLISSCLAIINDKNEQLKFLNNFSRASLLAQFNSGILQVKMEHHLVLKNRHEEWVNTVIDIVKNPVTNDVEAVMHITNIHYRKVVDSMVSGTIQREFEFIALAYVKSNSFVLMDRFNHGINEETQDFIGHFTNLFTHIISIQEELDRVLAEFTIENLVEKINMYGEYIIRFNSSNDLEKNHNRIMRFSFLNNRKDIITISCRDVTKIYNAELIQKRKLSDALYEAEKANKAKSEFLSLVSHDIRTPLNGIMGMTQLALKEDLNDKAKEYLTKAEMSSSFLLGLINDLLDMAKIESGKIELHPEEYKYTEFVDYINSIIRPLFKQKNMIFNISIIGPVRNIIVDKLRLNQIIFNLLSNAYKYTDEGGKVDLIIESEKINNETCILKFSVKDNGIGMSDEFKEHIFETFSQENRKSFNQNEGTGLGLSITHSLVELMGGIISVESKINKGTTFKVSITCPFINMPEEETIKIVEETESIKESNNIDLDYSGYKFLLCEDNIINQEIAIEILTSCNASVDVADDGKIGLKMFSESPQGYYSAIFMDIRMPNMDGLTASKEIRNLSRDDAKNIPIIAMTGNAMSADRLECIEAGMNEFLTKPIIINDLYKIMRDLIP